MWAKRGRRSHLAVIHIGCIEMSVSKLNEDFSIFDARITFCDLMCCFLFALPLCCVLLSSPLDGSNSTYQDTFNDNSP